MNVLLLQLDGVLPNLALMRIAAHHRQQGHQVELRQARSRRAVTGIVERGLFDRFDRVYASLIFSRSLSVARRLKEVYPHAIVGGTGWDLGVRLSDVGVDERVDPDYSDYPSFRSSIGFTQRGCRLDCEFCVVPRKEGKVRSAATIPMIWRGHPYPREILLLDNDFFGQAGWRDRISELRAGNFKVSFNQGINARMLSDEAAAAIASVDYRDGDMDRKRIYTAWDNTGDDAPLFRGLAALVRCGVKPDHICVYMLIGYWAGESEADWLYRQQRLREFGARPYPMPYVRNHLTVGFQRWCLRRTDLKVSWEEYKQAKCQPAGVKKMREAAQRQSLFMLEN